MAEKRHFYLCPPTYFEISNKINAWMDPDNNPANREIAQHQWDHLVDTYESMEDQLELHFLDPIEGLPDLVFPGDSVFLCGNKAIQGRFRHPQRQPEVAPKMDWFNKNNFSNIAIPDGLYFEGNAEAVPWNGMLFGGYGIRSSIEAYQFLQTVTEAEVHTFKMQEPFFHLDVAFLPLSDQWAAYIPEAFDATSREKIESLVPNLITVDSNEATELACNAIVVDEKVIIGTPKAPKLFADLKKIGFDPICVDVSEFSKSGGSVKCLTLEHYTSI